MHANIDLNTLSKILSENLDEKVIIQDAINVGGGSISSTYKLLSTDRFFFLKLNSSPMAEVMFRAEVRGLEILNRYSQFDIPEVITLSSDGERAYLIMELIESAAKTKTYWQELGTKLAALHRNNSAKFGLEEDNFIGSLPQKNKLENDWPTFFINQRIVPMIKTASNNNLIEKGERVKLESSLSKIIELMPVEPPALIHGDLWSGNQITNAQGEPCLIDPAVYYGHREMDIAFSHLFGGFESEFYQSYQEAFPMEPGFSQRIDLYNLYPLLVHLNLFGRSYISQINSTTSRFT